MEAQSILKKVVIILFACIVLPACKPEVRATALHLGDSLMTNSADAISNNENMQNAAVLTVFCAMGMSGLRNNDYWIPRIGHIQERVDLDLVFISLGSNDIHLSSTDFPGETETANQVAALLSSFAPRTTIYWILPHSNVEKLWSTDSHYAIVTQAIINARDSGKWPNLKTLDFDAWVASQKNTMSTALASDGIHLSEAGESLWAGMIQNAINTEFPIE